VAGRCELRAKLRSKGIDADKWVGRYAEMGQEQKGRCSYRYSALVQLKKYLQTGER
jgi:hypothetical protein